MVNEKLVKKGISVAKLTQESISFAFQQLKGDKFRTLLSLLGVTIGIFTIVAIFTAVDSLKENVHQGLGSLNSNIMIVGQYPATPQTETLEDGTVVVEEYKWWEYIKRPSMSYKDYKFLYENSKLAKTVSIVISSSSTAQYGRESTNCNSYSISQEWNEVSKTDIEFGRYFSTEESKRGLPVAIIGHKVAKRLFGEGSDLSQAVNRSIKLNGKRVKIIGILKKEGESIVSLLASDYSIFIPITFGKYFANYKIASAQIFIIPKEGVLQEDIKQEIRNLMRSVRRLTPKEQDNFSVDSMSFLLDTAEEIFSMIGSVGWIIAAFSLLIGGFGIANIMFVSVKERTRIIGIQKALGAKKYVILIQFLVEAIMLAIIGGGIGIALVYLAIAILPSDIPFTMHLSVYNIIIGFFISSIIGILSGVIPAWKGASLNPVDAINS